MEQGLTLTKDGVATSFELPPELGDQTGLVVYRGYLQVKKTGRYRFELKSSSKAFVRLHEACLLDADAGHKPDEKYQTTIAISRGPASDYSASAPGAWRGRV